MLSEDLSTLTTDAAGELDVLQNKEKLSTVWIVSW